MRFYLILPFLFSFLGLFALVSCIGGPGNRAPVSVYGTDKGAGTVGVHTVLSGDTLYSISKRYKIAMQDVAIDNNIGAPFRLRVGQRLRLSPPREYSVRPGDSLYTISRLFDVNRSDIARLNHLKAPYVLRHQQVLRLPSATRKPAVPVTRVASVAKSNGTTVEVAQGGVVKPGTKPVQTAQVVRRSDGPAVKAKTSPVKKKRVTTQAPKRSSSKFLKPVQGRVVSAYGPKKNGLHNDGINIRAARGSTVKAAENGVVVYAGSELKGSGNLILVRHQDRWMTAYAHMDGFKVKRGDVIKRGQAIGTVGSTGSVDSPQLHFEVRRGTEAINPSVYLEG